MCSREEEALWTSLVIINCDTLNCPMGFKCCESGCCPEKKNIWNSSNDSLRILFIVFLVMIPLLFICGLVKRFCCKCREPEQNLRRNRQIPPEAPTIAPIEMIWVTTLDPPPPYDQVILKPEEPPPPYSLRPEDPAGQMRGTDSTAF
ncbi:transmembrane protein 92 isoform X2 [Mesocricetus auratus]|uniref:Transmembrane protein 92 isoform X2 n=1 Tax=Mesocricetus auratus TaxID=10036 RepID=A0ABM2XV22_MESAU|nr:transmembrane protein 92 isoform X2 [Mesocricetus auratus]